MTRKKVWSWDEDDGVGITSWELFVGEEKGETKLWLKHNSMHAAKILVAPFEPQGYRVEESRFYRPAKVRAAIARWARKAVR
jgi:hypothetical protein